MLFEIYMGMWAGGLRDRCLCTLENAGSGIRVLKDYSQAAEIFGLFLVVRNISGVSIDKE
jgi:hypothetical protein